jgi:hypothetical protein
MKISLPNLIAVEPAGEDLHPSAAYLGERSTSPSMALILDYVGISHMSFLTGNVGERASVRPGSFGEL